MWVSFMHVQSKYMAKIYIHVILKKLIYTAKMCASAIEYTRIFRPI